ncbi:MAG TPA: hypothetical protein VGK93_08610 [Candidatus Eisenbacteria bacterium]|jgi:hypothetical protein
MPDVAGWSAAGWHEHRRRQHREFLALSFREKLAILEQMGEVAGFFAQRRATRGLRVATRRSER